MRSLHATALETILARDVAISYALILGGTYGYGSRRSANGYNMPRLQELTVEGVRCQGDSLTGIPDLVEDSDLAAENITVTIAAPKATPDSDFVSRHRASPAEASTTSVLTAALYVLLGDSATYATSAGTALLVWQGRVAAHEFSGDGERLTLTLEPLWADLAQAPGLRYDPQDQRRLHSGDTGLDHAPATRRKLALSTGTSTPTAERDPALLITPYRRYVYGRTPVQGDIVLMATSGASSRYLNLLVAFASHEVAAIERLWLDGREVEFSTGDTVIGNFAATLTVSRKLGSTSQAADSSLTTQLGTTLWPSTSQLKGIAYVSLRLLWDAATWSEGVPVVTALIKGKLCLDPRDTGAAPAWSDNPAVQLYDYLLDTVHGPGLASATLDEATFATAAETCAQAIELANGLTEPRYTSHLTATHEDTRDATITRLLSSMGGQLITGGSTLSLLAASARPSEATLAASDLVDWWREKTTEAITLRNTARGTYLATPDYALTGYPAVELTDWTAAEGERPVALDFPTVTSSTQAQRLAKIQLLRNRRRLTAKAILPLAGYRLRVGDIVTVTIPGQSEFATLAPVEMEITALTLSLSAVAPAISYDLRETAATDYAWATTDEGSEVTAGTLAADVAAWRAAKLQAPSLDKASQTFGTAGSGSITVNVASVGEPGATVRFTTDGTDPATSSTAWGGSARTFTATTTVKIIAQLSTLASDVVTYTYTLASPASITVNITTSGTGSVTGGGSATEGDTITLTATGGTGKGFIRWSGAYKSEVNPLVFTAGASNINLIAYFGDELLPPTDGGHRTVARPGGGYDLIQRIYSPALQPIRVRWSTDNGATWTSQITTLAPNTYVEITMRSGSSWSAFTADYRFADGSTLTYGQSPATSISYPAFP